MRRRPLPRDTGTHYAAKEIGNRALIASWVPFLQRTSADPITLESQTLAAMVEKALVGHTKAMNRGMRPEPFSLLMFVIRPSSSKEVF